MTQTHRLPFLELHRPTFELIRDGKKLIETRAGNEAYLRIVAGDVIEFSCGTDVVRKRVSRIERFTSLEALLTRYQPTDLNPAWSSLREAEQAFLSFPEYEKRIRDFGLLVFELEKDHE